MSTSAFQLRQLDRSSAQRQVAEAAPTSDAPPYSAFSAPGSENPSASTSQQHLTTLSSSEEEESAGWQAWVVVGAATVIFTCALGLVYSFGVTQQLLIERNFATASELGWVSTMSVIYVPLFALPMQMAVLRWGNRLVGVAGSILTSGGFFATAYCIGPTISTASSSAQRLAPIFVAQSVFGLGYGCLFWSATAIAAQWVSPRRTGFATGIGESQDMNSDRIIPTILTGLRKCMPALAWAALYSPLPCPRWRRASVSKPVCAFMGASHLHSSSHPLYSSRRAELPLVLS